MMVCSRPLISIVVPIYNIEDYVRRCLNSIIGQTYVNIEIILVDDGSTDNSSSICDEFAKKDSRVKVLHKENGGLVSARKAGVNIATGEYILNIDGDDWVEENWVEELEKQICQFPADMIFMSGYIKDIEGESRFINSLPEAKTYFGEEIRNEIFPLLQSTDKCFEQCIKGSLCMWGIKRELLKEKQNLVDDRISMGEDQVCVWFCLLAANSVSLIYNCGYHYIQRGTALSYSNNDKERERMQIWHQQLKNYIREYNVSDNIMRAFTFLNIGLLLLSDYEMLLLKDTDYLYPYSKVKKGSSIIIYGAGKLGYHIIYALNKRTDFKITLWVDQNRKRPSFLNYKISPVADILKVEYDFIVIAVFYEEMAQKIKELLLSMGISEEKIAMMDPSVICEEYLDRVYEENADWEE